MPTAVNINGRPCSEKDAVVSVFDHGFLFGEGVYEVLRTYHRQPFLYEPHMKRMRESAARIALEVPVSDGDLLRVIEETMTGVTETEEVYVRILLTRGAGEFTYDPRACPTPTLVVIAKPFVPPPAEVYERGVAIALVDVTRNHPRSVSPLIKSNNLLNNALAMQAAIQRGGYEALMRNYRGEICECSQSNFFLVRKGVAVTPPLDAGLLAGITRAFVFELGTQSGVTVDEATIVDADLDAADEAFITSTTKEIAPVVKVGDRVIGRGTPGPVTRRLMAAFASRTAALAAQGASPVASR